MSRLTIRLKSTYRASVLTETTKYAVHMKHDVDDGVHGVVVTVFVSEETKIRYLSRYHLFSISESFRNAF